MEVSFITIGDLEPIQERKCNASASQQIRSHELKSNFQEVKRYSSHQTLTLCGHFLHMQIFNSAAYYYLSGWRTEHSTIAHQEPTKGRQKLREAVQDLALSWL